MLDRIKDYELVKDKVFSDINRNISYCYLAFYFTEIFHEILKFNSGNAKYRCMMDFDI